MITSSNPDCFGQPLLKERARDYAPAFFLLLAVSLSGLRSALNWEVFASAVFCWAVFFRKEGFTLPGGLWPWFFGWLGIASIFSLEPLNSLSQFSKYLVFAFFLSLTSQGVENSRRAWTRSLLAAALICASVIFYQRITGSGVYGIIANNPNYSVAILAGAFAVAWVFMFSAADSAGETAGIGIGKGKGKATANSYSTSTLTSAFPMPLPAVSVSAQRQRPKAFYLHTCIDAYKLSLKEVGRQYAGVAVYGLLCAVFLAGIIAANSRGALLASILAAAAYLIISKKWRVLLYLAAALSLASAIVPADWLSFLFKAEDSRAYARVWIWGSALEAALARPFFGFGPGLFERAFELFKFPYFNGISYYGHTTVHAHSEVLNLAAEAGLPAAALFLGAVFYSVREKSRDAFSTAMKFCALALLIQSSFDMVFYSGAVSLLFFGSLGFTAGGRAREAACGESARPLRSLSLIFGFFCVLGLALRIAFDRDSSLALRPGADPAQSEPALRRALIFAPYDKNLLLESARARLLSSGNYAYAAAFVENAAVFCPKDPRFPYLAAEAFIYGANAPAAYNRLEKTLALEPEFLAARFALVRLLYSDGRLKAAAAQAAIAKKIASYSPRQRSVYDMLLVNFDLEAFENFIRISRLGNSTRSARERHRAGFPP